MTELVDILLEFSDVLLVRYEDMTDDELIAEQYNLIEQRQTEGLDLHIKALYDYVIAAIAAVYISRNEAETLH